MSFTPSFTMQQTVLTPNVITITDTSVGTDGTIASRRISFQKADGKYLIPIGSANPIYVTWALVNLYQDINILDKDYALLINVDWLDAGGNVLYTKSGLFYFTMYLEQFFYTLTQYQAANPSVVNDVNYWDNKLKLRVIIDEAVQAITLGSDIAASQAALDRGNYMKQNQTLFF